MNARETDVEQFEQAQVRAESWSTEEVLRWGLAIRIRVSMATGGGVEGMVLLDLASRSCANLHGILNRHRISFFQKPTNSRCG